MEVQLRPDQQAPLSPMATAQGCEEGTLAQEAVESLLSFEDWFEKWTKASRRLMVGQVDVRRLIERRYPVAGCEFAGQNRDG